MESVGSMTVEAEPDTKTRLKLAAQGLFGRFGIDGVSVQQIVAAAGQRNNASLHYHFGSKDELIRVLVIDGAQHLDIRRHELLNRSQAAGELNSVREILNILVLPVIELSDDQRWFGYIRFIANLQLSNRDVFDRALNNQWNSAYKICLNHLEELMKEKQPPEIIQKKLSLLGIYSNAVLTAREAAIERHPEEPPSFWSGTYSVENIIDTLEAMLVTVPTKITIQHLSEHRLSRRSNKPVS